MIVLQSFLMYNSVTISLKVDMKKYAFALAVVMALASGVADARGGGSSGGHGGGGGHASSGGHSAAGSRGGFSSAGGGSRPSVAAAPAPSRPAPSAAPQAPRTTTTTTTTTHSYRSQYVSPGPMYGGWGMGYGYNNGLLTGMIIGNMMHPHNTVMYVGPGTYSNNALLYPDGRVVNQQGYHVGNYVNGVFTPVTGGAMVAQAVPADAGAQQVAQPVVIQKAGLSVGEVVGIVFLVLACVFLLIVLIGIL